MTNTATGIIRALNSGIKHIATKRFTLRYPEEKLKFVGDGYQFDPSTGVGIAGLKGTSYVYSTITVPDVNYVLLHVKELLKQLLWSKFQINKNKIKNLSCHKLIMENVFFVVYVLMHVHFMHFT